MRKLSSEASHIKVSRGAASAEPLAMRGLDAEQRAKVNQSLVVIANECASYEQELATLRKAKSALEKRNAALSKSAAKLKNDLRIANVKISKSETARQDFRKQLEAIRRFPLGRIAMSVQRRMGRN